MEGTTPTQREADSQNSDPARAPWDPHWREDDVRDRYLASVSNTLRGLTLPVSVKRGIYQGGDPYGISFNAEALDVGGYCESWADFAAEVQALIELDAAGVSMSLVHELIWRGGWVKNSGAHLLPTEVLSAYLSGGDLCELAADLEGFDQHRDKSRDPSPETIRPLLAAYDETVTPEWIDSLIEGNGPNWALFIAGSVMSDEQFARASEGNEEAARKYVPERFTGKDDLDSSRVKLAPGARNARGKGTEQAVETAL